MENNFTTTQALAYLGSSPIRGKKLIKAGRLLSKKQGRDYIIAFDDIEKFARYGRNSIGLPRGKNSVNKTSKDGNGYASKPWQKFPIENGKTYTGDALDILPKLENGITQTVIADPPHFQMLDDTLGNKWGSMEDYLRFAVQWIKVYKRILRPNGLLYIFDQLGEREHV